MQKTLLSLGVIVLFVGLIVFSMSFQFEQTYEVEIVAGSEATDLPLGQWETSAFFEKGEKMYIDFPSPNTEEVVNGYDISGTVMINITDSFGENTTFRVDYKGAPIREMNLTLESKSESLEVDDSGFGGFSNVPEEIGGVTLIEGDFYAHIYVFSNYQAKQYYPTNGILPYIMFQRIVPYRTYQYDYLLPIGIILLIVGLILSAWAVKSSRRGSRAKRE